MLKSFLPYVLAILGFALILLAVGMPLFEWQISNIVTDFPSNYEVHVFPSPWKARFGDSFNDDIYLYKNISVLLDRKLCYNENINVYLGRVQKDKALEEEWVNFYKSISWLFGWSFIELSISVMYIWWYMIWYRHSFGKALGLTALAGFIFLNVVRGLSSPLFPRDSHGSVGCYHGSIAFDVALLRINYETPLILAFGILLEFIALTIMLLHIRKAIVDRNRPLSKK